MLFFNFLTIILFLPTIDKRSEILRKGLVNYTDRSAHLLLTSNGLKCKVDHIGILNLICKAERKVAKHFILCANESTIALVKLFTKISKDTECLSEKFIELNT